MNLHSFDDYIDELYGKIGTPERDAMETLLKEEVHAYFVGETMQKELSPKQ